MVSKSSAPTTLASPTPMSPRPPLLASWSRRRRTDGQGKKEGSVLEEAVLQSGERRPSLYCQKVGKFSGVEKGENGGSEGEKGYHDITENNGRQPPLNHWKGGLIRVGRVMILT